MEESNWCSETDPSELLNQLEYILESDPLIPFILYPDMHKNNFLLHRWREKIRTSMPLHIVTLTEIAAIVSLFASFIYLLGFFGIDVVQSIISKPCVYIESDENDLIETSQICPHLMDDTKPLPKTVSSEEDDEIIYSVLIGKTPSYSLESKLGVCYRAAFIRREAVQRITKRSLEGLPLDGFDYESILGQCCEMPIGYVQIPVGIAGPLSLNDCEYLMPMATTEGCLVASTNRGCKAIYACGGATGILLKDGMAFCQAAKNSVLNGRKNLYIRFSYSTGDAMGMNMVLKGVQNVLDFLQSDFPIWM